MSTDIAMNLGTIMEEDLIELGKVGYDSEHLTVVYNVHISF